MVDDIKYLKLPKITFPVSKDYGDDFAPLRGDYDGGIFAGYAGSYNNVVRQRVTQATGGGGTVTASITAVATGYLHVIQSIVGQHSDTTARVSVLTLVSGGVTCVIMQDAALVANNCIRNVHELVLTAGDYLSMTVYSIAGSKNVIIDVIGYKVRL